MWWIPSYTYAILLTVWFNLMFWRFFKTNLSFTGKSQNHVNHQSALEGKQKVVTYWPSTELSIKRCTSVNNRCIRLKISGYHFDLWTGWIRCNCDTYKKQVDVKQLYNPVPQMVWVSWSQLQLEFKLQFEAVRTSSQQRAWALSEPWLSSPAEWERSADIIRGTRGQYVAVCSVSNSPLTLLQPFRNPIENKVWEVYFSKEVCSFVIIVDYLSAYICIHIVVSQLYNKIKTNSKNILAILYFWHEFSISEIMCDT